MNKFIQVITFAALLFANVANSTLIDADIDLPSDTYVTEYGIDWAWVSSVNVENFNNGLNILYAPTYRPDDKNSDGYSWRFANEYEIEVLVQQIGFERFIKVDNGNLFANEYIWAVEYWNSRFTSGDFLNFNYSTSMVASAWDSGDIQNETFYVRGPELFRPGTNPPTNVPEPTNIAIFGLGLIALAFRKKLN